MIGITYAWMYDTEKRNTKHISQLLQPLYDRMVRSLTLHRWGSEFVSKSLHVEFGGVEGFSRGFSPALNFISPLSK